MKSINFRAKKMLVISHVLTTVPSEDLRAYLLNKNVGVLLYIAHPLLYKEGRPGSYCELYVDGICKKKISTKNTSLPTILSYVKDLWLTIYWVIIFGYRWDLAISLDNLNTFSALILRGIGRVKKVIYYTIDFTPQRFTQLYLNKIYHFLDRFAYTYANSTWNVSPRILEGRRLLRPIKKSLRQKQIVVPIGVWLDKVPLREFNEIESHTIVYAGSLLDHQGIQLFLKILPNVLKKYSDVKFWIIGMGEYEICLRKTVKSLNLEKCVTFKGYLESHMDVVNLLCRCGLGIALYNRELSKWSYYADPSKIKSYLAAGLPVVTTDLTYIASDLERNRCGWVVKYNEVELYNSIIKIFNSKKLQLEYRNNAIEYASKLSWDSIYSAALRRINF